MPPESLCCRSRRACSQWVPPSVVAKGSRVRYSMVLIIFLPQSCCCFVRDVMDVRSVAWQPRLGCLALVFSCLLCFVFFPKKKVCWFWTYKIFSLAISFNGNMLLFFDRLKNKSALCFSDVPKKRDVRKSSSVSA